MTGGWDTRWPDEVEARLIELWSFEPRLSTKEIGIRLGFGPDGKNRVIGKAHRLKLERRPSPIRPHTQGWTPQRLAMLRNMYGAGRTHVYMAEQLGCCSSWVQRKLADLELLRGVGWRPRRQSGPSVTLAPLKSLEQIIAAVKKPAPAPKPAVSRPTANFGMCCFVVASAESKGGIRYCDEPITTRGPYCDAHRAVAYRPKPTRTLQEVA
jgi:hypothetical protein